MKKRIITALFIVATLAPHLSARTIEIEVHGMTCSFCVDTLQRKFSKMDSVLKVDISLKMKKIRLETDEKQPKLELIKKAVLDSGFTPVKLTVLSDEKKQD